MLQHFDMIYVIWLSRVAVGEMVPAKRDIISFILNACSVIQQYRAHHFKQVLAEIKSGDDGHGRVFAA